MSVFLLAAPHLSSSLHCKLHFNRQSEVNRRYIVFTSHLNPKPTTIVSSLQNGSAKPSVPLQSLKPYLLSEYRPILAGWLFSAISVASLSKLVPKFSLTITTFDIQLLKSDGLVLGILVLSRLVSNYFQQALLWDAALNAMYKARLHVFGRVLDRDMGFFEGRNGVSSGDIAYRITAEAADVADAIYSLLNAVVPSTLQLSAMAVQMLAISPALSLVSALVIPCLALVIAYLGKRQRMIAKKANLSIAALSSYLNEVLPAILFVKANNTEPCEIARFKRLAYVDRSARLNKRKMKAVIPQIIQSIYIGALFIICAGSLLISEGSFNGCRMVSFITSLVLLIEPIQAVGKAYNELKEAEPAIERLLDLSRAKAKVMERPDAVHLDHVAGDVKFCDVSFKYGDDMPLVLDRIDLQIRAGETAALVGPSGGGKTTLAKLLLRLYDPSAGSIHIDNHNIQNIQLETLRRRVCLVSQDIALFSGTVAENIGYRDLMTGIQMERVEFAGKFANADEFIKMLPNGYQTNIGPRGSILSGGQKQRLAIARAVYQDPAILILDEATSGLDSRSELLVRQALQRLMESRTVLVIAHRLETVLMAKRIFSLDDGKLQEITRSSLLREGRDTLASERLVI